MRKFLNIAVVLIVGFLFSGCFEIIHYLEKKPDNTIHVRWMFSISSALTKDDMGGGGGNDDINSKMKNSAEEFQQKMKGKVSDVEMKEITTAYETGWDISYTIKDLQTITEVPDMNEGMPMVPKYNAKKNLLIFKFIDAKKKKENDSTKKEDANDKEPKDKKADNPKDKKADNPMQGMEDFAGKIMSSASYKIILSDSLAPKKVVILGQTTKKKIEITPIKLGNQHIIKIPFMSLLMEEKDGFAVAIQL